MDDMETVTVQPPEVDFNDSSFDDSWLQGFSPTLTNLNFDSSTIDPSAGVVQPNEASTLGSLGGVGSSISSILSALGGGRGILSDASGIMGLLAANNLKNLASQAFSGSNPFGPYRDQYAQQLNALEANPGSVVNDPGFTSARDQSLQQVQKSMAAQGYKGSGNMAAALYDRSNQFQLDYTQQKENQLANLAGAGISPNYGSALQGAANATNVQSSGLAALGSGLAYALPQNGLGPSTGSSGTPLGMNPQIGGFSSAGGEAATAIGLANSGVNLTNSVSNLAGGGNVISKANGTLGGTLGEAALGLGIYQGIEKGGVSGYAGAAADTALLGSKVGLLGSGVGTAAGYVAAPLALYNFGKNWQSGAGGMDAAGGASAGAAVGSIFGPIGTAVGAIGGAIVGGISSLAGPGKTDPETSAWNSYLPAAQKNPNLYQQVSNPFLLVAGLFDEKSSTLPFYQQYGRMGENKFTVDMTNQINQALSNGTISKTDNPDTVYSKVVAPWVNSMGKGWSDVGPEYTQAAQGLLKQMTSQYLNGSYAQNWKAVGGDYAFSGGSQGTITPFGAPPQVKSGVAQTQPTAPRMTTQPISGNSMASIAMNMNTQFRGLQYV